MVEAWARLNPRPTPAALDDSPRRSDSARRGNALGKYAFYRMVVDGVMVEYRNSGGAIEDTQMRFGDFGGPDNNGWLAVNQFTVGENKHKGCLDIVLLVNELPPGVFDLKNSDEENATVDAALWQMQTYKADPLSLFAFKSAPVISDGTEAQNSTLTAEWEWFKPWRTISDETLAPTTMAQLQVMLECGCQRRRFLAVVRDFIVSGDYGAPTKNIESSCFPRAHHA